MVDTVITNIQHLKLCYPVIKQPNVDKLQLRLSDIEALIKAVASRFQVDQIGQSYLNRPIYSVKVGNGPIKVLMWSQMHGDESTATAAIFDLLNYLSDPNHAEWLNMLEQQISVMIIPMVNPDGAEQLSRHNAQGIDINRDAIALQSPEAQLLNRVVTSFEPDFGFNLHDQNRYYAVQGTDKTATISLLAPAFNSAKDVNDTRLRAMQLSRFIYEQVSQEVHGCVGRYDDTYSARSFGDLFSAKGVSTILVESGYYPNDPTRQKARWLNFMLLVQSLDAISAKHYMNFDRENYDAIPMNKEDGFIDILLKKVNVNNQFYADYGMNLNRQFEHPKVKEVGDLSVCKGHQERLMCDFVLAPSKGFEVFEPLTLCEASYLKLLKQGFSYFIGDKDVIDNLTQWPVIVRASPMSSTIPAIGETVHMIFYKNNEPALALLHDIWITLSFDK